MSAASKTARIAERKAQRAQKTDTAATARASSSSIRFVLAAIVGAASIWAATRLYGIRLDRSPTHSEAVMASKEAAPLKMTDANTTTATDMSDSTLPDVLISRRVAKKVASIETPEGDGAMVRRSIGTPALRHLSPFLMLDYFHIAEGAGFPDHAHRGQVTATYMLEGHVQHEDFTGNAGTIGPGDLQWMTAGRGIAHAEMPLWRDPKTGEKLPDPVGLQLWIDLPEEDKFTQPHYQDLRKEQIPTASPRSDVDPEKEGHGWSIKVISGHSHGVSSPVRTPSRGQCWYFDVTLSPGGSVFQPLPAGWNAFAFTLPGAPVRIGDAAAGDLAAQDAHAPFHTLVLSNDDAPAPEAEAGAEGAASTAAAPRANGVWLRHSSSSSDAGAAPARLVLIAGSPLAQEVWQYGPFVLASREDVQRTLVDYQMKINGFERAMNWESRIARRARSGSVG